MHKQHEMAVLKVHTFHSMNLFHCQLPRLLAAAISNLFIQQVIDCSLFSAEAHFIPQDTMRDLKF